MRRSSSLRSFPITLTIAASAQQYKQGDLNNADFIRGSFRNVDILKLPNNKNELLYLYNKLGSVLFKEKWDTYKLFDTSTEVYPSIFTAIMLMTKNLSVQDKSIIINFVFSETVKRLTEMK